MDKRNETAAAEAGTERSGISRFLTGLVTLVLIAANAVFTAFTERCYVTPGDGRGVLLVKAGIWLVLFSVGTAAVFAAVRLLDRRQAERGQPRFFRRRWYSILLLALVFAGVYMLYLQIYWPGACGHDTTNQIKDLVTGMEPLPYNWINGNVKIGALMNDHHPVLTTLIFTGFYKLGLAYGSAETGMYLYCVVQIIVMSIAFSVFVCSMTEEGVPEPVAAAASLFYCMPFVAYYAVSMLKDSLFSVVFFLWMLCYLAILKRSGERAVGRGLWGLFILLSILAALTNKKGMYITCLSALFLVLLCKEARDRDAALLSAVLPVLITTVLLGRIIFPLWHIYPGGTQEALGFALQQTALTYMEDPGSFTEEDREVLRRVIVIDPATYAEVYDKTITDRIKERYNYYADREDLIAYLRLWVRQGLRHPGAYVRAVLMVNGGFFIPEQEIIVYNETVWYDSIGGFAQPEARAGMRDQMNRFYDWLCSMPLTAILFSNVLYLWWTPLLTLLLLLRRGRYRMIAALVPVAANILFLIMGPVCWTRYGLCQLYTVPILWTLPFTTGRRSRTPAEEGPAEEEQTEEEQSEEEPADETTDTESSAEATE